MYQVRSDTKPETTDATSSSKYNYYRTGVTEHEVTDEQTGDKHTEYLYSEEKVLKEQWAVYISQKQTEDALQELIMSQMEG